VKLLVIVLNYRVAELAIDCLRSLAPQVPKIAGSKVVVVENGSSGDDQEKLREAIGANGWETWAELIALPENLGFTGGNNLVIRRAISSADPPEYVLLLNADTVVSEGAFEALVRFMEQHPRAGIAGSRLEDPDGTPQGTPFRFHGIASELDRGLGIGMVSRVLRRWAACPPKPASASPVDWVAGASMIIRRQVIETVGPLDDGFFAYFEDMDYCLNAARAGWQTWYVPESRIVHLEGRSSGIDAETHRRRPAYWFAARRRYFLKNYGPVYAVLVDAAFIAGALLGELRLRIQGRRSAVPPPFLADSIRHSVFVTGFALRNSERE
jgi:GT2 family glycosyltransferase